ncbi:SLBB domain-containing protein [bacterium]|nr:SLBB domain-containing protein [bacterium]
MSIDRLTRGRRGLAIWAAGVYAAIAFGAIPAAGQGVAANPASVAQAAQQLGISPQQAGQIESQVAQGGLNGVQLQQACATAAAKHLGPGEIQAMGAAIGLSAGQIAKLQQCAQGAAGAAASAPPAPAGAALQPPPRQSQPASLIEDRFHQLATPYQFLSGPRLSALKQFGYALFSSPVSTFAPVADVPIGDDYVLGPGDGLNVLVWGRINRTIALQVQRDGDILMPEIGPLGVAGLTFGQAKQLIERRADQITGVHVAVTMGQIRTIEVFVVGKVNHPGLYLISALSHVSNALVAAGGVSKVGSLRKIELRRNGRTLEVIDLYDLLLHGDASADVRLESRDVLFVPVIGPVVGIAGDVKNPAIYELRGPQTLAGALRMAGGVSAFGYGQRVQVERIEDHERRIALDLDLGDPRSREVRVADGDLIKVFPVLPDERNVVRLTGNVSRPGSYQWYPGMEVADLVREGQGVGDHTFFGYARLRRVAGATRTTEFVPVDLGGALRGDPRANLLLRPGDSLTIYSESELHETPTITVRGEVRNPGVYPLTDSMRVSDLIYEAGGLRDDAYRQRAEIARTRLVNGARAGFSYISVDLRDALAGGPGDVRLARGDELFVAQASDWHQPYEVTIDGEVARPGPYVIRAGERLASLIERAGGLRPDAYLPATVFVRQSVRQIEQERLDQSRARLKEEIARLGLTPPAPGQGPNANNAAALAAMQQALASADSSQAVGRIVLHLTTLQALSGTPDDLALENRDHIVIPRMPASVNVLGQVYNPTAIVYQPGLTVRDYLARAGGPTDGADKDHIFVIAADGAVLTDEGIRERRTNALFPLLPAIGGGLMGARLGPGDTIYVPEQLVYVSGLQYATDITQIIANSAMALAVIGILGTSI